MITLREHADGIVEITVRSDILAEDVERALGTLRSRFDDGERVSLLVDLSGVEGVAPGALVTNLRTALALTRHLPLVRNAAVLGDTSWIRTMARLKGALLPDGETRVFAATERDRALAWLSAANPESTTRRIVARDVPGVRLGAGMRSLRTSDPSVLSLEIDGHVGIADVLAVVPVFREAIAGHEDIGLLVCIVSWKGMSGEVDASAELRRLDLLFRERLRRHAIVTSLGWVRALVLLSGWSHAARMRVFRPDEEDAAWDWVGARPADDPWLGRRSASPLALP